MDQVQEKITFSKYGGYNLAPDEAPFWLGCRNWTISLTESREVIVNYHLTIKPSAGFVFCEAFLKGISRIIAEL